MHTIDLPTLLFGDQTSNPYSSEEYSSEDTRVPSQNTIPQTNSKMTEIDFPDAESCNNQWAFICTSYEKSLSSLATKKRGLELRNDELVRINANLNANYKILKETVSELSADKSELVTQNNKLQNSLDYLREFSGYTGLLQRQKVDEGICAESWDRNRIFDARIPVQKGDGHVNTPATTNARTEKIDFNDPKDSTRTLELSCDCGRTFRVSGDNLSSINVKHGTSTTKSCQCKSEQKGKEQKGEEQEQHTSGSGRPQSIPRSINASELEERPKEGPRNKGCDGSFNEPSHDYYGIFGVQMDGL